MAAEPTNDMKALHALDPMVAAVMQTVCGLTADLEMQKQALWAALSLYYASGELFEQLAGKGSAVVVQPVGRT